MPRVRWGIEAGDVDDFDRESQYAPYQGPIPPNAVYQWKVKQLKSVAGSRDKYPQLRIGLELEPRKGRDENKYRGYFVMVFLPITQKTNFRYAPFLDAIGVSGREFTNGTITDEEGNVKKIGRWRNDGKTLILGQLVERADENGALRKEVAWMGSAEGAEPAEDEQDDPYGDDSDEEYADDDDYEEPDPPRRSSRSSRQPRSRPRRSEWRDEREDDPF